MKDNSTGKNKDFYELGKKMFDRLNPQIAHNPKVVGYVAPQRTWEGLTDEEIKEIVGPYGDTPIKGYTRQLFDKIEAKLREKNNG